MPSSQSQQQTQEVSSSHGNLFGGYKKIEGHFDEMLEGPDRLRPHWKNIIQNLNDIGEAELRRRSDAAAQAMEENGITYNVYSNQQGRARTWGLDILPMILSQEEWRTIEKAVIQRAKLLNLILSDCYSGQKLLKEGFLPPALVYGQQTFLRPCHGMQVKNQQHLIVYAVDLARSPDGQWWVLSDRTQAPSGSGYALENRMVMSRLMPDLISHEGVHRLTDFFRKMRHSLAALAPKTRDKPRVVLLTPGPYNETYFEHAYLARFLGYTLAQGEDLTVRDGIVYLKTLEGLRPVDVILRRVDDDFCDPLELRTDSFLGVPGLVQAARLGNVTIANALGSGLIQNPALLAFLPALSRHILGEDLIIPSIATWWCGQEDANRYVFDSLSRLVIKPTSHTGERLSFGNQLSSEERENLKRRVQLSPYSYVAQEQVVLSSAPSWINGKIETKPMALRFYAVASGDSFTVMPGGLTRVAGDLSAVTLSMQQGGSSKDTWVLTDSSQQAARPINISSTAPIIIRNGGDLPSRMADNLFWLGRYTERTETMARILRTVLHRLTAEETAASSHYLIPCLQSLSKRTLIHGIDADLSKLEARTALQSELFAAIFDPAHDCGLTQTIERLHHTASVLRDRVSNDTWRILGNLRDELDESCPTQVTEALASLNHVILLLSAFSGMVSDNMNRGAGWRFLDIGRRLERAVSIIDISRNILAQPQPVSPEMLEPLLEICDSVISYRMRYFSAPQLGPVLDLLIAEETNPRAAAFQIVALQNHIANLPRENSSNNMPSREERLALAAVTTIRLLDFSLLHGEENADAFLKVESTLTDLALDLPLLSDVLTRNYFAHASFLGMTEFQPPVSMQQA